MAKLANFSPLLLYTATVMADPSMQPAWSAESVLTIEHARAAKRHYEDRPSLSLGEQELVDEYEFEALPLVPTRNVTAQVIRLEKLPPMVFDFDDE
jgi:hypothetical protein